MYEVLIPPFHFGCLHPTFFFSREVVKTMLLVSCLEVQSKRRNETSDSTLIHFIVVQHSNGPYRPPAFSTRLVSGF